MSRITMAQRWAQNHYDGGRAMECQKLSPRERDVAARVAEGLEIKEIASELGIGYHTVKMHIRAAKRKMGVRNQLELALVMVGKTPRSLQEEVA